MIRENCSSVILDKERFVNKVLEWYDKNRRSFPWRAESSKKANPYHVWLSEIMLQQTGVATVIPYFLKFIDKWPTLEMLAQADENEVLTQWAGLGYYSRARNLHRCANVIVHDYGGVMPQTIGELLKLPGIGDYTAHAIHAIAFDRMSNVVDGNIERIMARLVAFDGVMPKNKKEIKQIAASYVPTYGRHGCYAQALMDLGSMVCTPKNPKCDECPVSAMCMAYRQGMPEIYPKREPIKKKTVIPMVAFVLIRNDDGAVLMRYRDKKHMLGGMLEVPSTPWSVGQEKIKGDIFDYAPFQREWVNINGAFKHVFSHFSLNVTIYKAYCDDMDNVDNSLFWVTEGNFSKYPIPTLTKKILTKAL